MTPGLAEPGFRSLYQNRCRAPHPSPPNFNCGHSWIRCKTPRDNLTALFHWVVLCRGAWGFASLSESLREESQPSTRPGRLHPGRLRRPAPEPSCLLEREAADQERIDAGAEIAAE